MKKILGLLFFRSSIFSMQLDIVQSDQKSHIMCIEKTSVFVPEKLGSLQLYHHDKKGFSACQDDKKYEIKKYFTDPIVRNVTKKQLKSFLQTGYLSINQMDDGEYSLKAKGRINGGGPVLGAIAYWVTKSLCY